MQIIHWPVRPAAQPPVDTAESLGVGALADVVSLHLYGSVAACAPTTHVEVMREHLAAMLLALNQSPYSH